MAHFNFFLLYRIPTAMGIPKMSNNVACAICSSHTVSAVIMRLINAEWVSICHLRKANISMTKVFFPLAYSANSALNVVQTFVLDVFYHRLGIFAGKAETIQVVNWNDSYWKINNTENMYALKEVAVIGIELELELAVFWVCSISFWNENENKNEIQCY